MHSQGGLDYGPACSELVMDPKVLEEVLEGKHFVSLAQGFMANREYDCKIGVQVGYGLRLVLAASPLARTPPYFCFLRQF